MAASPLMVVTLVVRPRPAVAALDHVLRAISSYLDNSGLIPLDHASAFGPIRLLDRIWENSNPETQGERRRWSLCKHLRSDAHYYRYQFMKSLRAAVTRGDLGVVRWIMEHFSGCKAGVEVVEDAARHGRLEILQYLLEYERQGGGEDETRNTIWWGTDDLVKALEGGFPEVARWLYENTPEADRDLSRAMEFAVRRGDLSVIRWLLDVVYRPDLNLLPPALNDAAAGGHMELLQWIFEQGYEGRSDRALEGAAKNGRADMVEWLVNHGITEGGDEAAQAACEGGHLSILRWLHDHKLGHYALDSMHNAIHNGYLHIVKYLYDVHITDSASKMMREAALNGHLDIVKWLREKYEDDELFPPLNSEDRSKSPAMDEAASNGHLHVLKYLHSISESNREGGKSGGPSCSNLGFQVSAALGHLDVVKWLYHTYPEQCRSHPTISMAAMNGQLEILQWLHDHASMVWTTTVMDEAAGGGHLSVVKWLHANRTEGCTESAMDHAACWGHLNVVRWLNDNRSEGCTSNAMDQAAGLGYFEVLLYLRDQRTEGSTTLAKLSTLGREHKHILAWLEEHYPDPLWN